MDPKNIQAQSAWDEEIEEFPRRSRAEMVGILGEEKLLPKNISP